MLVEKSIASEKRYCEAWVVVIEQAVINFVSTEFLWVTSDGGGR
jgi:hypothetical protein